MQFTIDFYAVCFLLGAAQAVFLATALLFSQYGYSLANRILAAFLAALSILLAAVVAYHSKFVLQFPHLIKIEAPFIFVYGPLIFLYTQALTSRDFVCSKRLSLHFIPFAIYALYLLPFYFRSAEAKAELWTASHAHHLSWQTYGEIFVGIAHLSVYLILTIRLLNRHAQNIKDSFSALEKINLSWIRRLLLGFAGIWVFYAGMYVYNLEPLIHVIGLLTVGMIYYLGFKGLTQPEIFAAEEEAPAAPKYARTALAADKAEVYRDRLLHLMKTEKPFIETDLSLQKLAKKLAIPSHHLSQVINEKLQQNFFEFVSSYRIAEAKKLLADPAQRNLNIAEIGFNVGFNSLSTFNAAFKQHAHMTPSQFRKTLSQSKEAN